MEWQHGCWAWMETGGKIDKISHLTHDKAQRCIAERHSVEHLEVFSFGTLNRQESLCPDLQ
jgi:Zn-dependent M16 (insulinase) family peptidase